MKPLHHPSVTGLVVRCRLDGIVDAVLLDAIGTDLRPESSLAEGLAPDRIEDGLWLLTDVVEGRVHGLRGLDVLDARGTRHQLLATGCTQDGPDGRRVVLVAAEDPDRVRAVVSSLVTQDARLGARLQAALAPQPVADDPDRSALLALSAANNELMGLHRRLSRRTAELEAINRRKDEILGMVAHDLRNPLGSIGGFSRALERQLEGRIDDRAALMLERISRLSDRMLRLVEDLLDVSVIEGGQLRLQLEATPVVPLVVEVVDSHRYPAARKGVLIDLDVPDDPLVARLDGDRFTQVVDNLLSNAVKFSPVRAGAVVSVACERQGEQIWLGVQDEGPGMAPEVVARLFEPFTRGEHRTTDGERSSGLGLAIARSIITAHGGRIEVDSEEGRGACLEVRIPVEGPDA